MFIEYSWKNWPFPEKTNIAVLRDFFYIVVTAFDPDFVNTPPKFIPETNCDRVAIAYGEFSQFRGTLSDEEQSFLEISQIASFESTSKCLTCFNVKLSSDKTKFIVFEFFSPDETILGEAITIDMLFYDGYATTNFGFTGVIVDPKLPIPDFCAVSAEESAIEVNSTEEAENKTSTVEFSLA
jgi:hypothetical protein